MPQVDEYALKQKAAQDWRNKPEIREQYSSEDDYYHYLKADAAGLIKRSQ